MSPGRRPTPLPPRPPPPRSTPSGWISSAPCSPIRSSSQARTSSSRRRASPSRSGWPAPGPGRRPPARWTPSSTERLGRHGAGPQRSRAGADIAQRHVAGRVLDPPTRELALRIANASFAQRDWTIEQAYLDGSRPTFGAGVRLVDYIADHEAAREAINAWVSDQTQEADPGAAPPKDLTALTRLVLVNAIYLKAEWQDEFSKGATEATPFTRLDGSRVEVPTMIQGGGQTIPYARGNGWQAERASLPGRGLDDPARDDAHRARRPPVVRGRLDESQLGGSRRRWRPSGANRGGPRLASRRAVVRGTVPYSVSLFMPRFGDRDASGPRRSPQGARHATRLRPGPRRLHRDPRAEDRRGAASTSRRSSTRRTSTSTKREPRRRPPRPSIMADTTGGGGVGSAPARISPSASTARSCSSCATSKRAPSSSWVASPTRLSGEHSERRGLGDGLPGIGQVRGLRPHHVDRPDSPDAAGRRLAMSRTPSPTRTAAAATPFSPSAAPAFVPARAHRRPPLLSRERGGGDVVDGLRLDRASGRRPTNPAGASDRRVMGSRRPVRSRSSRRTTCACPRSRRCPSMGRRRGMSTAWSGRGFAPWTGRSPGRPMVVRSSSRASTTDRRTGAVRRAACTCRTRSSRTS